MSIADRAAEIEACYAVLERYGYITGLDDPRQNHNTRSRPDGTRRPDLERLEIKAALNTLQRMGLPPRR